MGGPMDGDGTLCGLAGPSRAQGPPRASSGWSEVEDEGAFCPAILLVWDPTWFLPSSVSGKLPDGTYGPGYKVIIVGTQRVYVSSRSSTASYIDGPIL